MKKGLSSLLLLLSLTTLVVILVVSCRSATTDEEEETGLPGEDVVTKGKEVTTSETVSTPELEPTYVHLISQEVYGDNRVCYNLTVHCNSLPIREAQIRATHFDNANGAIIFAGGGLGKNWYGDGSNNARIVSTMWEHGFETYEIAWGGDQGWATDCYGEGFKRTTCAFSEVVRWITTDLATNPEYIAITGSSGGSWVTAYGLALHNLEEVVDIVVLTSGPVFSDVVGACCIYTQPSRGWIIDYIMGWVDNGDYCQTGDCTDWLTQALQIESIVSPIPEEIRDYYYPNTKVVFIEGETDDAAVNQGAIFYDAITSGKIWIVLPGVGHGVPGSDEGAAMIQEALLDDFKTNH